jgi:hypothetical protein
MQGLDALGDHGQEQATGDEAASLTEETYVGTRGASEEANGQTEEGSGIGSSLMPEKNSSLSGSPERAHRGPIKRIIREVHRPEAAESCTVRVADCFLIGRSGE